MGLVFTQILVHGRQLFKTAEDQEQGRVSARYVDTGKSAASNPH